MNFNVDWFVTSLPIMGKGMFGIFIVISVIYGLVAIMNSIKWRESEE